MLITISQAELVTLLKKALGLPDATDLKVELADDPSSIKSRSYTASYEDTTEACPAGVMPATLDDESVEVYISSDTKNKRNKIELIKFLRALKPGLGLGEAKHEIESGKDTIVETATSKQEALEYISGKNLIGGTTKTELERMGKEILSIRGFTQTDNELRI